MLVTTPVIDATDGWITPSLVASLLALLFTVGSFWWIQVRRGRLCCFAPVALTSAYGPTSIVLVFPLVFHNPAPAPIVITGLRLRIDLTDAMLVWTLTLENIRASPSRPRLTAWPVATFKRTGQSGGKL